jgi:histone demethylase JARID1
MLFFFLQVPDLIYHLVTMIGPSILVNKNIDTVKAYQHAGEFMVTFPQAFHGGFSTGFNTGEAVNFAAPDWLTHGQLCSERYRTWARGSPISRERLVMAMARNLTELDSLGCQLLWDQIKILRDEQERLRREVYQAGVLHAMQMPHEKADDEEFDEKRLCSICQHLCFFSAVVCSCDPDRVACLRHHNQLCKCNRRENCFLFWYTVKEMDDALEKIAAHIKKLKAGTIDLTLEDSKK